MDNKTFANEALGSQRSPRGDRSGGPIDATPADASRADLVPAEDPVADLQGLGAGDAPDTAGKWRQWFGYGLADFSCNLIWTTITLYLMYFYTDVMGITAAAVGLLFLLTRVVDGVTDVLMGVLIDRTNTRWGKSRPYFIIGAIPFGLFAVAAFWVPPLGDNGKLAWAYVTYIGLSLAYTMVNIPLASILPSLTGNADERTNLATTRILFAFTGATVVSAGTLPLVGLLGGGSQATGFRLTMLLFAVLATVLFVITFFSVRERVAVNHERVSFVKAAKSLARNRPWQLFALNIVFMWGGFFLQQGVLIYFFTYYVGRQDFVAIFAGINTLVPIVGTFATPFIARFLQKRTLFLLSSGGYLAGLLVMFVADTNVAGLVAGAILSSVFSGTRMSIYFSMQADPVDYGEWKSGVNTAGVLSACNGFIGKLAMAGSGALTGALLTWANYQPDVEQTPEALSMIRALFLAFPAGLVVISMAIMWFYRLDDVYPQIRSELDRRTQASNSLASPTAGDLP